MATLVITVDIPEDGFDDEVDVIAYRDKLGELLVSTAELQGFPFNVNARIEYVE